MKREIKRIKQLFSGLFLILACLAVFVGCDQEDKDVIVLRVSNWEEYIDQGEWDAEEAIELEDGTVILGESSLVEDFEQWFFETYGKRGGV